MRSVLKNFFYISHSSENGVKNRVLLGPFLLKKKGISQVRPIFAKWDEFWGVLKLIFAQARGFSFKRNPFLKNINFKDLLLFYYCLMFLINFYVNFNYIVN